MNLVLYSNIPFTKEYNVVVNNATIKLGYTETALDILLRNNIYTTFSNIDYYLTFPSGEIIIDKATYTSNGDTLILEYNKCNYIAFQIYESGIRHSSYDPVIEYYNSKTKVDYLPFKVYAFIDSINLVNDCYVIKYSIDYIHTYMAHIKSIRSHVIRYSNQSYVVDSNGTKAYPKLASNFSYKSNMPLKIQTITDQNDHLLKDWSAYSRYYLMVQLQFYKLGLQGEKTDRFVVCFNMEMTDPNNTTYYALKDQIAIGDFLFLSQGSLAFTSGGQTYYYEIMHVYIVPNQIITSAYDTGSATTWTFNNITIAGYGSNLIIKFKSINYSGTFKYYLDSLQFTKFNNKYKHVISLGTFSNQIPYEFHNDNMVNYFYIDWQLDDYNLDCVLRYEDKIVNILKDFEYEYPYSVDNATANQLARFTREYTEKELNLKGAKIATNMVTGIVGGAGSIALGVATGGAGAVLGAMGGAGSIIGTTINTIFSAEELKLQREKNNAKLYTNNSMSAVSMNNKLNIMYGIIAYIVDPDYIINEQDVNTEIQDSGFICDFVVDKDIIMNNLETSDKNPTYVKFNETTINGLFDNDTNQILTAIFNKGFKFYDVASWSYINKI